MFENVMKRIKVILIFFLLFLTIMVIIFSRDKVVSNMIASKPSFPYDNLDPFAQEFVSDIPILVFRTDFSIIRNKDAPPKAVIWIFDNGKENRLSDIPSDAIWSATANYRGTNSLTWPKKAYKLKLYNSFVEPLDYAFLGFEPASEWVLHSPYADKSLIRNWFSYELAATVLDWQPRGKPIQLFTQDSETGNIVYAGVYLLCEYITEGDTRLDIGTFSLSPSETVDFEGGGYIFQRDRDNKDNHLLTVRNSVFFRLMSPNINNINSSHKDSLINEIAFCFDLVTKTGAYADTANDGWDYQQYIDVDAFIDYFLVSELVANKDAGVYSTYIYRPVGEKFIMGPVWDCDLSMGNYDYYGPSYHSFAGLRYPMIGSLLEDEAFSMRLVEKWQQYRNGIWSNGELFGRFDAMTEYLTKAAAQNAARWPQLYDGETYIWPNPEPYTTSWEEEIVKTRFWLENKVKWLDDNIPRLIYESAEEINNSYN